MFANPSLRELLCKCARDAFRACIIGVCDGPDRGVDCCPAREPAEYEQFIDEFQKAGLVRVVGLVRLERWWWLRYIDVLDAGDRSLVVVKAAELIVTPSHVHAGM